MRPSEVGLQFNILQGRKMKRQSLSYHFLDGIPDMEKEKMIVQV